MLRLGLNILQVVQQALNAKENSFGVELLRWIHSRRIVQLYKHVTGPKYSLECGLSGEIRWNVATFAGKRIILSNDSKLMQKSCCKISTIKLIK